MFRALGLYVIGLQVTESVLWVIGSVVWFLTVGVCVSVCACACVCYTWLTCGHGGRYRRRR